MLKLRIWLCRQLIPTIILLGCDTKHKPLGHALRYSRTIKFPQFLSIERKHASAFWKNNTIFHIESFAVYVLLSVTRIVIESTWWELLFGKSSINLYVSWWAAEVFYSSLTATASTAHLKPATQSQDGFSRYNHDFLQRGRWRCQNCSSHQAT